LAVFASVIFITMEVAIKLGVERSFVNSAK
jgi:hypothetical protein